MAQIYVGTYAKYNNGSLFGEWVDVEDFDSKEDFYEYCKELHSDEDDAEFMFQDWEDIPEKYISESWVDADLWDEFLNLSEDEKEMVEEYWKEADSSAEVQSIIDKFVFKGDVDDFIDNLLGELCVEVPSWLVIDKTRTWNSSLCFDYECTGHYIFSNY